MVDPLRHADFVLGFSHLCSTRRRRLESRRGESMALDLGDFTFRAALQSIPDVDFILRIKSSLSLLSGFPWFDGRHLYLDDIPASEEFAEFFLGPVAGEERRRGRRRDCRAASALCRILGQCSRA